MNIYYKARSGNNSIAIALQFSEIMNLRSVFFLEAMRNSVNLLYLSVLGVSAGSKYEQRNQDTNK